ncbi:hypothetical protein V1511DRAFT_485480 [Dipodascopsis uninucleata]
MRFFSIQIEDSANNVVDSAEPAVELMPTIVKEVIVKIMSSDMWTDPRITRILQIVLRLLSAFFIGLLAIDLVLVIMWSFRYIYVKLQYGFDPMRISGLKGYKGDFQDTNRLEYNDAAYYGPINTGHAPRSYNINSVNMQGYKYQKRRISDRTLGRSFLVPDNSLVGFGSSTIKTRNAITKRQRHD